MQLVDYLRSTGRVLAQNRFRTLLTLLGIVLGAATIVFIAGLLRSGDEALIDLTASIGDADTVVVHTDEAALDQARRVTRPLGVRDVEPLQQSLLVGARAVSVEHRRQASGTMDERSKDLQLVGGDAGAQALYKLELRAGRFLRDEDSARLARVCVVGDEVWRELAHDRPFADGPPALLHVEGVTLLVVGVLAHKPTAFESPSPLSTWDRKVLLPEATFANVFEGRQQVDRLVVRMPHQGGELRTQLRQGLIGGLLQRLHYGVKNFSFGTHAGVAQQMTLIKQIIRTLMICTGLLAMFAGGLNISNIMIIAVQERTREIGVRRALGASRRSIQLQFLLEAATLSLLGGLAGVAGGIIGNELVGAVMVHLFAAWSVHVESWSVVLALGLALLTGVVFGVAPARAAASLDPVEALRSTD